MSECYVCEKELNDENRSEEHIILNACGGRLSSQDLLCKNCNNDFGSGYDVELARQTSQLSNLLHIKRDRNKPPGIKGTVTSTGEAINIPFEGAMSKVKPKIIETIEGNQVKLTIEAKDDEQFAQILNGLKRTKYPGLPIEQAIQDAQSRQYYLNDSVTLDEKVGGDDVFRAVTKAAVNFFIYTGGDREYIRHLIPYLRSQVSIDVARIHHLPLSIYSFDNEEVSHIIKLVGNPSEGVLYCYLEYFNAQAYIIKLNEEYDGAPIDDTYIYDVVHRRELKKTIAIDYSKSDFMSIFSSVEETPFLIVRQRYARVVTIAQKRNDERYLTKLSQQIVAEVLKDLPEGAPIDTKFIEKLAAVAAAKYTPFIMHKRIANQKLRAKKDTGASDSDAREKR
jgi:hypothetical protein